MAYENAYSPKKQVGVQKLLCSCSSSCKLLGRGRESRVTSYSFALSESYEREDVKDLKID